MSGNTTLVTPLSYASVSTIHLHQTSCCFGTKNNKTKVLNVNEQMECMMIMVNVVSYHLLVNISVVRELGASFHPLNTMTLMTSCKMPAA